MAKGKYTDEEVVSIVEGVLALKEFCRFVKDIGVENVVALTKAVDVIRAAPEKKALDTVFGGIGQVGIAV